jgi:hypothetical protein
LTLSTSEFRLGATNLNLKCLMNASEILALDGVMPCHTFVHCMPHFCSWHVWSKLNMSLCRCFHHIDWFQHFMSMVLCIFEYDWRSSYFDCIYGFLKTTINDLHMDYGNNLNNWGLFMKGYCYYYHQFFPVNIQQMWRFHFKRLWRLAQKKKRL